MYYGRGKTYAVRLTSSPRETFIGCLEDFLAGDRAIRLPRSE